MATIPAPEETGKRVLAYYGKSRIRPGEMMLLRNISIWWINQGGRADDLEAGLKWLEAKGFLESQQGKPTDALFLTESGFAAI